MKILSSVGSIFLHVVQVKYAYTYVVSASVHIFINMLDVYYILITKNYVHDAKQLYAWIVVDISSIFGYRIHNGVKICESLSYTQPKPVWHSMCIFPSLGMSNM